MMASSRITIYATVFAAATSLLAHSAHAVTVADIAGDWIDASTLPAGWEYLESTAATGGAEVALTPGVAIGNAGATGFGGGANTFNLSAVVGDNADGDDYEIFGDGDTNAAGVVGTDLIVHPSGNSAGALPPDGEPFVIVRYTFGIADVLNGTTATIAGGFNTSTGGGVDASVLHNSSVLFAASGNVQRATAGAFNETLTIAPGDTISFVVGSGSDIFGDETAIRGTIDLSGPAPVLVPVLDLDFQGTQTPGFVPLPVTQSGFTAFETHHIAAVPDPTPSVDPSITVGSVTFAVTGSVGGFGTASNGNDDLDRDFMFLGSALGYSESIGWTLSGLDPNTLHALTWYAGTEGDSDRSALITAGLDSGLLVTDGPDLVLFAMSDAFGVITGAATRNGTNAEANLAGLSVVAVVSVPAPAALTAGLAMLGVIAVSRRR